METNLDKNVYSNGFALEIKTFLQFSVFTYLLSGNSFSFQLLGGLQEGDGGDVRRFYATYIEMQKKN